MHNIRVSDPIPTRLQHRLTAICSVPPCTGLRSLEANVVAPRWKESIKKSHLVAESGDSQEKTSQMLLDSQLQSQARTRTCIQRDTHNCLNGCAPDASDESLQRLDCICSDLPVPDLAQVPHYLARHKAKLEWLSLHLQRLPQLGRVFSHC